MINYNKVSLLVRRRLLFGDVSYATLSEYWQLYSPSSILVSTGCQSNNLFIFKPRPQLFYPRSHAYRTHPNFYFLKIVS